MNYAINRVSGTLGGDVVQAVHTKIREIEALMPMLQSLTAEERKRSQTIGGANKLFVEDATELMERHPELLPRFVETDEVKMDYQLYQELDELCMAFEGLLSKMSDTRFLAGAEAYNGALLFYQSVKFGARAGASGARSVYEQLRDRFKTKGPKGEGEETELDITENPDLL